MNTNKRLSYWLSTILFLAFSLGPILLGLLMSLTPSNEITQISAGIWPSQLTLDNYIELLDPQEYAHQVVFNGIINSLIAVFYTLLIGLPLTVLTAYIFVRYEFKYRSLLLKLILITIVVPVFATIIPIYAIFSRFQILNNLFWLSVIYVSAFTPFVTWLLIVNFRKLPKSLWEAAWLDGCNEWKTFWWVILPVSKTSIFSAGIILTLMSWSQYQIPMILTAAQSSRAATLVLSEFMTRDAIDYSLIAAAGMIIILPPLLLTVVFRKALITRLTDNSKM